jgi:hypothetical protein
MSQRSRITVAAAPFLILPMDQRCPDGEALPRVTPAVWDLNAGRVNATANQGNR